MKYVLPLNYTFHYSEVKTALGSYLDYIAVWIVTSCTHFLPSLSSRNDIVSPMKILYFAKIKLYALISFKSVYLG